MAAEQGNAVITRAEYMRQAEDAAGKEKLKGEIKDLLDPIEVIMDKGVDNVTKIRQEKEREREEKKTQRGVATNLFH